MAARYGKHSTLRHLLEFLTKVEIQEEDDLFETISQAMLSAVDRSALSGWGAQVYIM